MALGDALQKRMEELAKHQPMIGKRLADIAEGATLRAVDAAVEKTPPNTFGTERFGASIRLPASLRNTGLPTAKRSRSNPAVSLSLPSPTTSNTPAM